MKPSYVHKPTYTTVDLSYINDGVYMLNRVYTPPAYRRLGGAREAMREMLADADKENVTIILTINPYGPMNYRELSKWYIRCGFYLTESGLYERLPNGEQNDKSGTKGSRPSSRAGYPFADG